MIIQEIFIIIALVAGWYWRQQLAIYGLAAISRAMQSHRARRRAIMMQQTAQFFEIARARYALAITKSKVLLDVTNLYNCLAEQQLVSTAQLGRHIRDCERVRVHFYYPYEDIRAIIDIAKEDVVIEFLDGTMETCLC